MSQRVKIPVLGRAMFINSRFKIAALSFDSVVPKVVYCPDKFDTLGTAIVHLEEDKMHAIRDKMVIDFGDAWLDKARYGNYVGTPVYFEINGHIIDLTEGESIMSVVRSNQELTCRC